MALTLAQILELEKNQKQVAPGTLNLEQASGQKTLPPDPSTVSPNGHVRPNGITNQDVATFSKTKTVDRPSHTLSIIGNSIIGIPKAAEDVSTQIVLETIKPFLRTGVSLLNLGAAIGSIIKGGTAQDVKKEIGSPRNVGGAFGDVSPVGGSEFLRTGKGFAGAALDATSTGAQIGLTLPTGNVATKGIENGLNTAKSAIADRAVQKSFQEALDISRPVLSKTEEVAATEAGRKTGGGILSKVKIAPLARDFERAAVAKEAGVTQSTGEAGNIRKLQQFIDKSVAKVRSGLQASQAIWNKNELKGALNNVEIPITVKSDTSLARQAGYLKSAAVKIAEGSDKKTVGILDTRQAFDRLINKEYPNLYEKEQTPIRQYIRQLRQAINDFAESKIPDGNLPDGSSFKQELKKQNLAIEAKGNIAEKAPKAGTTKAGRFLKAHPLIKKAVIGTAGALGLTGVGEVVKHLP